MSNSKEYYKQLIIDHYKSPRNYGRIHNAVFTSEARNISCGDKLRVDVVVSANGTLEDVKYEGEGCSISIASMSILSEKIVGKSVEEILNIESKDILLSLGMTEDSGRVKCALLGIEAVKKAVKSIRRKDKNKSKR